MNRRDFLKGAAGAVVGAAIVPKLPKLPAISVASPIPRTANVTMASLQPFFESVVNSMKAEMDRQIFGNGSLYQIRNLNE